MGYENYDMTPEATPETGNLGSFQNPIWTDMVSEDLMPKIRFTTDQAEAQEAAQADRSNPLDLPDAVFYVEPKSDAAEDPASLEDFSFQNDSFGLDVSSLPKETASEGGSYVGPSPEKLSLQLEQDMKNLESAQERLEQAIERGTGVMSAMSNVENAQNILDTRMKLYQEAIASRSSEAPVAASAEATPDHPTLGSVSHAEWRLETAYEHGSQAEINAAKRYMAQELAKEERKKMEQ